jgi:hypothetical protein
MIEKRYAILIGSSSFQDPMLQNLRCPENDVDGLYNVLSAEDLGNFDEVIPLKNLPHHEVLPKINQVLKQAGKNDLVLVYYSGHGKQNTAGKLHLATTDTIVNLLEATSIPVDTILTYIEDFYKSKKFVLILDCCYAGAAGSHFLKSGIDDQLQIISWGPSGQGSGRGIYLMAASTATQVAMEKESDQYGIFTKHLVEGIKSGEADTDGDGLISADELFNYAEDHVSEEGSQRPQKYGIAVSGDLFLAKSRSREERYRKIRKILMDYASEGILPDHILSKALIVIGRKPTQLRGAEHSYNALLDKLYQNQIGINQFNEEWHKIDPELADERKRFEKKNYNLDSKLATLISWFRYNKLRLSKLYVISSWTFIIGAASATADHSGPIGSIGVFLILISLTYLCIGFLMLGIISYRYKYKPALFLAALAPINIFCLVLSDRLTYFLGINSYKFYVVLIWVALFAAAQWIMQKRGFFINQF